MNITANIMEHLYYSYKIEIGILMTGATTVVLSAKK